MKLRPVHGSPSREMDSKVHQGKDIPDGLEVAPPIEGDKQVVQPEKEVAHLEDDLPIPTETAHRGEDCKMAQEHVEKSRGPKSGSLKHREVCGMRMKLLIIILAVGTVFVLGLAIGLGVGLSSKDSGEQSAEPGDTAPSPSTSPPVQEAFSIGGGLNDSYYSTKGAWNGSGIAYNWQTFSSDLQGQLQGEQHIIVYYQHYLGAIRWMRRSNNSRWLRGPEASENVAVDAKNATPISAVHLNQNLTKLWHVFCKHGISPAWRRAARVLEHWLTSFRHRSR